MQRTFGRTHNCAGCRFWSEMIAQSVNGGPVEAICLNLESPVHGKYMPGASNCSAWKVGHLGAVDDPGNDGITEAYEEDDAKVAQARDFGALLSGITDQLMAAITDPVGTGERLLAAVESGRSKLREALGMTEEEADMGGGFWFDSAVGSGEDEDPEQLAAELREHTLQVLARAAVMEHRMGELRPESYAKLREILAIEEFQYCRACGCSQNDACPGSCSWVEPDLCSACAAGAPPVGPRLIAPPATAADPVTIEVVSATSEIMGSIVLDADEVKATLMAGRSFSVPISKSGLAREARFRRGDETSSIPLQFLFSDGVVAGESVDVRVNQTAEQWLIREPVVVELISEDGHVMGSAEVDPERIGGMLATGGDFAIEVTTPGMAKEIRFRRRSGEVWAWNHGTGEQASIPLIIVPRTDPVTPGQAVDVKLRPIQ